SQQTFFQNASHELKTPLMTIQGYAEGIRDGVFTGEDAEVGLNVIASEVNRLKVLINELTLLSKLDSEKNDNEQEKIHVRQLIQKPVDRVRTYAVEQSVVIEYTHDKRVSGFGDEDKILRAIHKVMMNSARYASSNVEVKITETKEQVFIAITDDGTGIDEAIR